MTSVASIGPVTTIGLAPPATGVTRAGDKADIAAVPASTTVTLGQGTSPALTYTSQPAAAGVVWERDAADKVSSVIADTISARTLAGRLEGVASALLDRFQTAIQGVPGRGGRPGVGAAAHGVVQPGQV